MMNKATLSNQVVSSVRPEQARVDAIDFWSSRAIVSLHQGHELFSTLYLIVTGDVPTLQGVRSVNCVDLEVG